MRVLITGGAGFIGSHIAEYFQGKAEVRILDNLRTGFRRNLEGLDVQFIEGDIRDRETVCRAMEGVECVFHLAALISVPESMEKITECIDINGNGMVIVLESTCTFYAQDDLPTQFECFAYDTGGRELARTTLTAYMPRDLSRFTGRSGSGSGAPQAGSTPGDKQ